MIKLVPDPTFDTVVRLTVPGHPEPIEVPMTFRYMSVKRCAEWFKSNAEKPAAEALAEIVQGWRGVMGEDGKEVAFSADALADLVGNYAPAANEILRAWQLELTESRVKN